MLFIFFHRNRPFLDLRDIIDTDDYDLFLLLFLSTTCL